MLREKNLVRPYPSKSVWEDLATRVGPASYDDWSPFDGLAGEIEKQFSGSQYERFVLEDFIYFSLEDIKDFNPSKLNTKEVEIDGIINVSENCGYKTLDDVWKKDKDQVLAKFRTALIGYKINGRSPYITKHAESTYTYRDNEDGYYHSEEELLEDEVYYGGGDREEALQEIPYLLKIMHRHSCIHHYMLFSFLRAYADLCNKNPNKVFKNQNYSQYTTIRLKSDGSFDRYYDAAADNKGEEFPAARKFIEGAYPNDPAYKAAMKLLMDFEILELNIMDESPENYTGENIKNLICTKVPTNEEYFDTYGEIDNELITALKPENLYAKGRKFSVVQAERKEQSMADVINCIRIQLSTAKQIHPEMFNRWENRMSEVVKYVNMYMRSVKPDNPYQFKEEDFTVYDGILMNNNTWVTAFTGKDVQPGCTNKVILTSYGLIIRLDPIYCGVSFADVHDVIEYLEGKEDGEADVVGWSSFSL